MPNIGPRCHELRIDDEKKTWRIVYRIDQDAIIILEVFSKKTARTPKRIIDICQKRLKEYDDA
jgi:phage-related protein